MGGTTNKQSLDCGSFSSWSPWDILSTDEDKTHPQST